MTGFVRVCIACAHAFIKTERPGPAAAARLDELPTRCVARHPKGQPPQPSLTSKSSGRVSPVSVQESRWSIRAQQDGGPIDLQLPRGALDAGGAKLAWTPRQDLRGRGRRPHEGARRQLPAPRGDGRLLTTGYTSGSTSSRRRPRRTGTGRCTSAWPRRVWTSRRAATEVREGVVPADGQRDAVRERRRRGADQTPVEVPWWGRDRRDSQPRAGPRLSRAVPRRLPRGAHRGPVVGRGRAATVGQGPPHAYCATCRLARHYCRVAVELAISTSTTTRRSPRCVACPGPARPCP